MSSFSTTIMISGPSLTEQVIGLLVLVDGARGPEPLEGLHRALDGVFRKGMGGAFEGETAMRANMVYQQLNAVWG